MQKRVLGQGGLEVSSLGAPDTRLTPDHLAGIARAAAESRAEGECYPLAVARNERPLIRAVRAPLSRR